MSEIAQLIDELRDYGKERKGEIADLVTRAADALEQLYSGKGIDRRFREVQKEI